MSDDVLTAGARRVLPSWVVLLVAAVALVGWAVLAPPHRVVDGHGSRPDVPVHVPYQPLLGRPLI